MTWKLIYLLENDGNFYASGSNCAQEIPDSSQNNGSNLIHDDSLTQNSEYQQEDCKHHQTYSDNGHHRANLEDTGLNGDISRSSSIELLQMCSKNFNQALASEEDGG